MKNLMFLLLGFIFIVSSCSKDDPEPNPNPNPNPTVYRAVVQLNFSDLPQGIGLFGTVICYLYDPGAELIIVRAQPELVNPPQYNWELDTALVRQYKGKEVGLYYGGCMQQNQQASCIPLERDFLFTLKIKPDINSFFIDIVLPDEGAQKIDDEEKADKFR